jgi:hypothetical protein
MKRPILILVSLGLIAGCGDDPATDPAADPAAEACAAFGAAATPIAATVDRAAAPTLPVDQPLAVTLPAGSESWVTLAGPADLLLFSNLKNVVTGLYEGSSDTNGLPAGAPNEDCPTELPEHFDLGLESAGPWALKLGPAAVNEVWLMLTPASGHGH